MPYQSFRKFVAEEVADVIDIQNTFYSPDDTFCTVYKNPTAQEYADLFKEMSGLGRLGDELGAILSGRDFYVWDRQMAQHRIVLQELKLPPFGRGCVPFVIITNLPAKSGILQVATFSSYLVDHAQSHQDTLERLLAPSRLTITWDW